MFLKITSPDSVLFEWGIKKVVLPTESWEIWILPWHIPLVSIIKPWIVRIVPEQIDNNPFIKDSEYIFENEFSLTVSKWLIFVDWQNITVTVSSSDSSPDNSEQELQRMKENLAKQVEQLKLQWSIEEMDKIMISLQKIDADLKLMKKKGMMK